MLISFLVRRWTVRAAGCSFSKTFSHVLNSSGFSQPRRVLIETGREVLLTAFLKHSTARSGVLIMAAPPPALLTCLSGQPKFKSMPEKPSFSRSLAQIAKCSGFLPQIWAIIGESEGAILRRSRAFQRPFSEAYEETLVNSVKNKSGRPALAITWRKEMSVTPSIGASIKKGVLRSCQIMNIFYHIILTEVNRRREIDFYFKKCHNGWSCLWSHIKNSLGTGGF